MPATFTTPTELRRWTSADYHRMAEAGILHPDEPVELIAGQIVRKMSPQGSPHAAAIRRSRRWFEAMLGDRALVQAQLPIQLDDYSEPEPDIAIVQPDPRDYSDRHPTAAELWLLIEVSDSTLAYDCNTKAQVYAEAGIPDYWVLDIQRRQLHLFRQPQAQGYAVHQVFQDDQTLTPLNFPDAEVAIALCAVPGAIADLLPLPPLM